MTKINIDNDTYEKIMARKEKQKEIFENISKERLMEIAHKMHTWIFIHSGDEYEVYEELGLSDEENLLFGYGGQYIIEKETTNEEN